MFVPSGQETDPPHKPARRTHTAFSMVLISSPLLANVLACTSGVSRKDQEPDPPASRSARGTSPGSAPGSTTAHAGEDAQPVLPEPLVGAWESDDGGDATIAYRFTADGRYRYAGILAYPSPDGIVQITVVSEGTARADGENLLLRPARSTMSRTDPGDPTGDYTDRPGDPTPERHGWQAADDGVLWLTDEEGVQITFRRQSA